NPGRGGRQTRGDHRLRSRGDRRRDHRPAGSRDTDEGWGAHRRRRRGTESGPPGRIPRSAAPPAAPQPEILAFLRGPARRFGGRRQHPGSSQRALRRGVEGHVRRRDPAWQAHVRPVVVRHQCHPHRSGSGTVWPPLLLHPRPGTQHGRGDRLDRPWPGLRRRPAPNLGHSRPPARAVPGHPADNDPGRLGRPRHGGRDAVCQRAHVPPDWPATAWQHRAGTGERGFRWIRHPARGGHAYGAGFRAARRGTDNPNIPPGGCVTEVPESGLSAGEVARRLGIAATTVRTWDRRYGLGPSRRDPGRHRRYNRRDFARLEVMRQLVIQGVTPAEAARIARDLRNPDHRDEIGDEDTGLTRSRLVVSLRRAALALDPAALEQIASRALADGVVPAWTTVFAPTLREIGRRHSVLSRYIAAEHLLSAAISAALSAVARPAARPSVLLACAP